MVKRETAFAPEGIRHRIPRIAFAQILDRVGAAPRFIPETGWPIDGPRRSQPEGKSMKSWIRVLSATLVAVTLLAVQVGTATASAKDLEEHGKVNIVFDALILRPLGLAMTAVGGVLFAFPVGPIVGITRPADIGQPLDFLVLRPARYTFSDPLGHH